jgi:hypothetical protein
MKFSANAHSIDLSSYRFYKGLAIDGVIVSLMQLFPSSCS